MPKGRKSVLGEGVADYYIYFLIRTVFSEKFDFDHQEVTNFQKKIGLFKCDMLARTSKD